MALRIVKEDSKEASSIGKITALLKRSSLREWEYEELKRKLGGSFEVAYVGEIEEGRKEYGVMRGQTLARADPMRFAKVTG